MPINRKQQLPMKELKNEAKARIKAENAKAQSDARIAKLEAIIEELKNKNN